jgi:mRNA degradation ribonuclease J1/J2
MINTLKPRFTFPMHDGGSEHQYTKFKKKAERLGYPTEVIAAQHNGDVFVYKNGEVRPYGESGNQNVGPKTNNSP